MDLFGPLQHANGNSHGCVRERKTEAVFIARRCSGAAFAMLH